MTPMIDTPRLRLRGPGLGDATRLTEYLNNFAVSGNLARVPHPYTLDHARQWLGNWRADAEPCETRLILELKGEGAIGNVGFHRHDENAMIGYWLGEPFWGQGLMTEALDTLLAWYFEASGKDVIVSGVFHFNMPSLAIQQKLGFVETGRSRMHCLARGQDVEHIDTELTREAFELSRPQMMKAVNS